MGTKVARLKLRCFLEGIEVPVIAAQVQCESNSPAVASIQLPPMAEGTRFHPRTLVHLYFLDFYESASPLISLRGPGGSKDQNNPSVYEQKLVEGVDVDDEHRNERYKLLFVGELVGFQWTKSASNRALVLQCQDLSNYWDYAQQWENTDLFGPGYKAMFSGGSTNMFTDFLSSKDEEIVKALMTPSAQYPQLKGLLGGIIHLLEKIGGSYYSEKKFGGQNIFYTLAELRLRTTQMITAYDKDDTANKLLNAQGYESLWGRILGNLGDQVSFRQAINALMGVIFHETYPIPTPLFVPGSNGTTSGVKRTKMRGHPKYGYVPAGADLIAAGITAVHTTVLESDTTTDRNSLRKKIEAERKTLGELRQKASKDKLSDAAGIFATTATMLGKALTKFAVWKPGSPQSKQQQELLQVLDEAATTLRRAARLEKVESSPKKATPARLNSHIFRPDVWFTAPPRCNVIFPDQYSSLTYARNFMQEPTRLLLKTNDAFFGEDELFDQFYFAPKAVTTTGEKRTLQALLSGELLDHELFTGILPVFEKMSETNIFAVRSGSIDGKMPKVGLAQRTANFLYFKYRFAARQMQIVTRFNPYVAPGFPGLIIDKYVDVDRLENYNDLIERVTGKKRELRNQLGTHFLANFAGITHSLDQKAGGTTAISCTYARDYNESVEFLGAIEKDQQVQKKTGEATRKTDVAAISPPALGSLGPNYGVVSNVEDVTDAYSAGEDGQTLPLYRGSRRAGANEFQDRVPVGVTRRARDFGPEVEKIVTSPFQFVTFKAYRVTEDVPKFRKEAVDLPAEEYIRPGWYGDAWNTRNVGKVYDSFFRIGSITDETQIADPNGASTGSPLATWDDATAGAFGMKQSGFEDEPEELFPERDHAPAILTLPDRATIADAVAFLVTTYSYVRQAGLDADEFIRAYTWRPIASLPDMFGSSDLELSSDGLEVVKGVEGFHSKAFGPYEDLFGLVPPEVEDIIDIKVANKARKNNDTRKRKFEAVQAYVAALQFSRAIVG
jgi:hypothetical protein